jgi:polyphosphate glucokinase
MLNDVIGVDIGGTAIKMGIVDVYTGELKSQVTFETPRNCHPTEVFEQIKFQLPEKTTSMGFGIPCIVKNNTLKTAPKEPSWVGLNFKQIAESYFNIKCEVLNDADAAALAEIKFGAMRNLPGVTVMLTFGTGIGTAIYYNGSLLMNTEFGRMALPGGVDNAEDIASARVKSLQKLRWAEYAERVNIYLDEVNKCFWPDNVVIGGGVSDYWKDWGHLLRGPFNIYKASLGNNAGLIGAALYTVE